MVEAWKMVQGNGSLELHVNKGDARIVRQLGWNRGS